jgi:hypothetical protein
MKKLQIIRSFILLMLIPVFTFCISACKESTDEPQYYEIKVYSIDNPLQDSAMDIYLKDAFIPAMHRAGIPSIGVFKPIEQDSSAAGKFIYVFISYNTIGQYQAVKDMLGKDPVYQQAGKAFLDAPFDNPPFERYESIFLKAFAFMPEPRFPSFTTPVNERIYELRSYESATEAKAAKKIHMFNEGGEIGIFNAVGANAVFYGEVLLGSLKPRLMYMTTYADMKSHDACWAAFRVHPDWKRVSGLEEYSNTVSNIHVYLLHPTSYSDF